MKSSKTTDMKPGKANLFLGELYTDLDSQKSVQCDRCGLPAYLVPNREVQRVANISSGHSEKIAELHSKDATGRAYLCRNGDITDPRRYPPRLEAYQFSFSSEKPEGYQKSSFASKISEGMRVYLNRNVWPHVFQVVFMNVNDLHPESPRTFSSSIHLYFESHEPVDKNEEEKIIRCASDFLHKEFDKDLISISDIEQMLVAQEK